MTGRDWLRELPPTPRHQRRRNARNTALAMLSAVTVGAILGAARGAWSDVLALIMAVIGISVALAGTKAVK